LALYSPTVIVYYISKHPDGANLIYRLSDSGETQNGLVDTHLISVTVGNQPAGLLLSNANIVNVCNGEIPATWG
jgi:hypothetical protein